MYVNALLVHFFGTKNKIDMRFTEFQTSLLLYISNVYRSIKI